MYRQFNLLSLLITVFFFACGGDEEEAPSPVKMEPPAVIYGLHGETYQNQRYVFSECPTFLLMIGLSWKSPMSQGER